MAHLYPLLNLQSVTGHFIWAEATREWGDGGVLLWGQFCLVPDQMWAPEPRHSFKISEETFCFGPPGKWVRVCAHISTAGKTQGLSIVAAQQWFIFLNFKQLPKFLCTCDICCLSKSKIYKNSNMWKLKIPTFCFLLFFFLIQPSRKYLHWIDHTGSKETKPGLKPECLTTQSLKC